MTDSEGPSADPRRENGQLSDASTTIEQGLERCNEWIVTYRAQLRAIQGGSHDSELIG